MNQFPHRRLFLSTFDHALKSANFRGFEANEALENGGGLAQREEDNGRIVVNIALFPYFIATFYTFNNITKPGQHFDIPADDASEETIITYINDIITRVS